MPSGAVAFATKGSAIIWGEYPSPAMQRMSHESQVPAVVHLYVCHSNLINTQTLSVKAFERYPIGPSSAACWATCCSGIKLYSPIGTHNNMYCDGRSLSLCHGHYPRAHYCLCTKHIIITLLMLAIVVVRISEQYRSPVPLRGRPSYRS